MIRIFCLMVSGLVSLSAQSVTARSETRFDRGVRVESSRGPTTVTTRSFDVDALYPNGRSARGYFSILYDPSSQLFFWRYSQLSPAKIASAQRSHMEHPAEFTHGWIPVVSDERIVLFHATRHALVIWESSLDKARDLNDAEQKSLQAARGQIQELQTGLAPRQIVPYLGLPREFTIPSGQPVAPKPLTILSVTRVGSTWELVLESQWKEKIVLDNRYRALSHQRLP